jgi:hypothetical protein
MNRVRRGLEASVVLAFDHVIGQLIADVPGRGAASEEGCR